MTVPIDTPPPGADQPAPEEPSARRRRRWPWVIVAGVVAVGLVYAADIALAWDDVPRSTTVAGIDVSTMRLDEAEAVLAEASAERAKSDIPARVGEQTFAIPAAAAGLELDESATLEPVSGPVWNPVMRVRSFWEPTELDPIVSAGDGLDQRLDEVLEEIGTTRVDASVRFEGVKPIPVYPADGHTLDVEAARLAVLEGWFPGGVVNLPMRDDPAAGTKEMVDQAILGVAGPAMAGPVKVVAVAKTAEVQPSQIAAALSFTLEEDGLKPKIDPAALEKATGDMLGALASAPSNARIRIIGGAPVVLPSATGWSVPPEHLANGLAEVLTAPAPRQMQVAVNKQEPELTTEQAQGYGVREKISSFTTYHSCCQPRVTNIQTMARLLDGYLVKPGEKFDLNNVIGPRDRARGFVEAPMIYNGEFRPSVGGGVSQFATTLYNAVFFGGLKSITHSPHSYYFSKYPAGREATVSWPAPDLIFQNDSDYGVVIDTSYTSKSITVSMYSTKRYDIQGIVGPKHNFTTAGTKYIDRPGKCIPSSASQGFTITNTRIFRQNGAVVKTDDFTWKYKPVPKMICGSKPS